jgi:exonuclease V gamma subunit
MDPGAGRAVLVCGNDNKLEVLGYEPPASPRAELHRLVRLYLRGLREPLALFPGASWCFSKALHGVGAEPGWFDGELPGGEENRVALELGYENALHAWSAARDCDLSDPYIARLFEGREPLTDPSNSPVPVSRPFAAHAVSLWGGMWKGRRTRSQMDWL